MLEKLEAHTKNESFVKRMQELAADPKFSAAATGYVEDMAQELTEGGGDVSGFGAELEDEDDDDDDDDDGYESDDELDEEDEEDEDEQDA
jgi:hypothetical protein